MSGVSKLLSASPENHDLRCYWNGRPDVIGAFGDH